LFVWSDAWLRYRFVDADNLSIQCNLNPYYLLLLLIEILEVESTKGT
jgi:hypothetical protein